MKSEDANEKKRSDLPIRTHQRLAKATAFSREKAATEGKSINEFFPEKTGGL